MQLDIYESYAEANKAFGLPRDSGPCKERRGRPSPKQCAAERMVTRRCTMRGTGFLPGGMPSIRDAGQKHGAAICVIMPMRPN